MLVNRRFITIAPLLNTQTLFWWVTFRSRLR